MSYADEFEEFKVRLKEQWLDYYEANKDWVFPLLQYHNGWTHLVNKEYRPPYYMILSAIGDKEPKLKEWLSLLCKFGQSSEDILKNLELNFDPRTELKNRSKQRQETDQKEAKKLYKFQRLLYLFLTQNSVKSKQLICLLGLNLIPNLNMKQCLETIANYELIAQELIELEQTQTASILPESYIDSNSHYLNQIREKIQQEKSII